MITRYQRVLTAEGASPATIKLRSTVLRRLPRDPLHATTDDVYAVTDGLTDRATVNIYLRQLRAAFRDFRRLGWRDDNPAEHVKPPRPPKRPPRPLNREQIDALLNHPDPLIAAMSRVGYYAGLRIHEVAELRPDSLEQGPSGWQLRIDGKGDKTAAIPAHPEVVAVFRQYDTGQRGTLFGYKTGTLQTKWRKGADAIGLKRVTFHQLRHSCATTLYRRTGDLLIVSRMLRHTTIATTQQYALLDDDRLFSAVGGL